MVTQTPHYSPQYLQFVEHFNRGEFRAGVEPLEEIWFGTRDDFHKALIRLCVGLNQMRLGLDSGPRFLLGTARELLQPYHPRHNGLDLAALDAFIVRQQARLNGLECAEERVPFQIVLDPPPARVRAAGDE